jgi:serine/threonine-protein kinase RsbT
MIVRKDETLALRTDEDIVRTRHAVRAWAVAMGFSLIDQTRIVTAASELARNTLLHGGGGEVRLLWLANGARTGFRLEFTDRGPGIADIALAMRDGYSSSSGLGLGLSGSKRLMTDFEIDSRPGEGTRVTVTRWR